MSNLFNINRFVALVRQGFIHDYKMYLISLTGFCGSLFIVLFLVHLTQSAGQHQPRFSLVLYILTFIGAGLLYSGSAFAAFRSKEKTISYLMIPASRLEKFIWEYLSRVIIFMIAIPICFWAVYNASGSIVSLLREEYLYRYLPFFIIPEGMPSPGGINPTFLIFSIGFFILTIPFAGATIFVKHPLIKTLFGVSIIFFFHLFLVYFFIEVLNFKGYNISPKETEIYLVPNSETKAIRFFTFVSLLANGMLTLIAYFKLKEKEV